MGSVYNSFGGAELKIHCSFDAEIPIAALKPHPRNPNKHPKRQIKLFAKILKAQGIRRPVTVSRRSGFIVAGHGLALAAQQLKLDTLPVDYQDFESEEQELAHLCADNKLAELSPDDEDALRSLMLELEKTEFDLELAGLFKEDAARKAKPDYRPAFPNERVTESNESMEAEESEPQQIEPKREPPTAMAANIIPLMLHADEYSRWQAIKKQFGIRDDREAFVKLMTYA